MSAVHVVLEDDAGGREKFDLGIFVFVEYAGDSLSLWRNTSDDPDAPDPDVVWNVSCDDDGRVVVEAADPEARPWGDEFANYITGSRLSILPL